MDWQDRIALEPAVLAGKPTVKGTRISVELVLELLAQGWSTEELLANYPVLTKEDVQACLRYASETLKAEKVYPIVV